MDCVCVKLAHEPFLFGLVLQKPFSIQFTHSVDPSLFMHLFQKYAEGSSVLLRVILYKHQELFHVSAYIH